MVLGERNSNGGARGKSCHIGGKTMEGGGGSRIGGKKVLVSDQKVTKKSQGTR